MFCAQSVAHLCSFPGVVPDVVIRQVFALQGRNRTHGQNKNQRNFFRWSAYIELGLYYILFLSSVAGLSISAPSSRNREP